jgi:heat shock protein HslJ
MIATPFRWLAPALAAALLTSLAACSTTAPTGPVGPTGNTSQMTAPSKGWTTFLSQHQWQLASAVDRSGQPVAALQAPPDRPVEARFGAGPAGARLSITGGCNAMGGSYQVSDTAALTVSQMAATRRACVAPLMQIDHALSRLLGQPMQLSQDTPTGAAPRLTMRAADGSTLQWTGKLTPEARYGAFTTVFYEVGSERLPCSHPLMPNARCLQVREIKYDAQGLVIGTPGAWQNLYQEIEGYTHTPGQRQVLRIKKFQRPQPLPADASSIVLVLDMVVRTETIAK